MLWTQAIPTHATIVTFKADRAVMVVTVDPDLWLGRMGDRRDEAEDVHLAIVSLGTRPCSGVRAKGDAFSKILLARPVEGRRQ